MQHGFLCGSCWAQLTPLTAPFCARCALPFEFETDGETECGACLQVPPAFDWARAAVTYSDLGRAMVLKLKYSGATAGLPVMATMVWQAVADHAVSVQTTGQTTGHTDGPPDSPIDLIVPVPLHPRRLFSRRFNQSQLLAVALSGKVQAPVDSFILKRRKATPSQGGLGRKARFKNVAAAFAIAPTKRDYVTGKHILLVDDVLTTGATANECARVLKRAGAASVGIASFARVGQPVSG